MVGEIELIEGRKKSKEEVRKEKAEREGRNGSKR